MRVYMNVYITSDPSITNEQVRQILSEHECQPSLVHGDLWTGNVGATDDGEPVIFDPATYYGDREVDIAMTQLFGSLSDSFYKVCGWFSLYMFGTSRAYGPNRLTV